MLQTTPPVGAGCIRPQEAGPDGISYERSNYERATLAVQLRTGNLATQGLPYMAPEHRGCRNGCPRTKSLSHVLQGCPLTHHERITKRHNELVAKVAKHARKKGWTTEVEPYVYHQDGQLYKPDLAIHQPDNTLVICDVQVCWEGPRPLARRDGRQRSNLMYTIKTGNCTNLTWQSTSQTTPW
ncbi:hypothetical protein QE152_g30553 [Popillia japonica]|uniref:Retrovirus-related Pol polyprotein from type-1 retrotransposable element R2 n=1 Tax=Popillia japonica TaxID=7064 RepID=A0AAW1JED1_POPJA